jgi:hypothetical protein
MINWLDDSRDLVDESNRARYVIQDRDFANLLPWIWNVLEKFHDSMWNIFESTQVNTFVVPELPVTHIAMVFDNFTDMLRGQVLRKSRINLYQVVEIHRG